MISTRLCPVCLPLGGSCHATLVSLWFPGAHSTPVTSWPWKVLCPEWRASRNPSANPSGGSDVAECRWGNTTSTMRQRYPATWQGPCLHYTSPTPCTFIPRLSFSPSPHVSPSVAGGQRSSGGGAGRNGAGPGAEEDRGALLRRLLHRPGADAVLCRHLPHRQWVPRSWRSCWL